MGTRVISAALTLKDKDFSSNLRKASERVDDLGRGVTFVGNKVQKFSTSVTGSLKRVASTAAKISFAGLAVGAVGLGSAVGSSLMEMDNAFAMLSAKTGKTGEDLKSLESVAKNVFKAGFGDDLTGVTDEVAMLKNMFDGIGDKELIGLTKNTSTIAKIMGADTKEVGRAIKGMTENFEGLSKNDAADLITTAFQKTGDYSDDLLDTFNEYGVHFSKLGLSAEQFTGILSNASGAFQLDKVGDAVKEFGIRAIDGSKGTAEGFKAIGLNADEMAGKIGQGGESAQNAFVATLAGLASIEDANERNAAGTMLFGTQWEDVKDDVVLAMAEGKDSIEGFEGATKKAGDTITSTFGSRVSQIWRDLTLSLAEVAQSAGAKDLLDSLATTAEGLIPKITSLATKAMDFANTIRNNWGQVKETIIGIGVAVTAFTVIMGTMKVIGIVTALVKGYKTALELGTVAQWAFTSAGLASPFGLIAAGIAIVVAGAVLLYRNWDTVVEKTKAVWKAIGGLEGALRLIMGPIGVVIGAAIDLAKNWDSTKSVWENVWGAMKRSAEKTVNSVIGLINSLIKTINNIPFVNIDTVSKVGEGEKHSKKSVVTPNKIDKTYGLSKTKKASTGKYGLGSYAVGSNNLESDQIAQVHKGEMIIPARQAQNLRSAGYNIDNIDKDRTQTVATTGNTNRTNNVTININGSNASSEQIMSDLVPKLKLAIANM